MSVCGGGGDHEWTLLGLEARRGPMKSSTVRLKPHSHSLLTQGPFASLCLIIHPRPRTWTWGNIPPAHWHLCPEWGVLWAVCSCMSLLGLPHTHRGSDGRIIRALSPRVLQAQVFNEGVGGVGFSCASPLWPADGQSLHIFPLWESVFEFLLYRTRLLSV